MIQAKITTVGNSLGVILPKEILSKLHVQKGDPVYFIESADGITITAYDQAFIEQMSAAEEIMHEDKDVLRVLSKK